MEDKEREEMYEKRKGGVAELAAGVSVDYPQEREIIDSEAYSFRINAPESAQIVDVRINSGEWKSCRRATGYWWYDWSQFKPGAYEIIARMQTGAGDTAISSRRRFQVINES